MSEMTTPESEMTTTQRIIYTGAVLTLIAIVVLIFIAFSPTPVGNILNEHVYNADLCSEPDEPCTTVGIVFWPALFLGPSLLVFGFWKHIKENGWGMSEKAEEAEDEYLQRQYGSYDQDSPVPSTEPEP